MLNHAVLGAALKTCSRLKQSGLNEQGDEVKIAGTTPSDRSAVEWAVQVHVIYCTPLLPGKCRHSKLIPVHRLEA